MISMGKKTDILYSYFIEKKPIKVIARETVTSKNTVKGYVREYEGKNKELINSNYYDDEIKREKLIEEMTEAPKYNSINRTKTIMTKEITNFIDECLVENAIKQEKGIKKQNMKRIDIYEELVRQYGFKGSYPSVVNYCAKKDESNIRIKQETFIKQIYEYGDVCEFDWGDVKLEVDGIVTTYKEAVFTLAKSNFRYAYIYKRENTQSFIDAHIKFFKEIGGVPKTMVYDNMKIAVAKFVGKTEKEVTIELKQLSTYYGFKFRFCNVARGNEKGHVENGVGYIRRKVFSFKYKFVEEKEIHEYLTLKLKEINHKKDSNNKSPYDELLIEKVHFKELPPDYSCVIKISLRVDKQAMISYKQNYYSVPDYLNGRMVDVKVYINNLSVYYDGQLVATHQRSYKNRDYSLDINHYRNTLMKKPGAIINSMAFEQMGAELKEIFNNYFKDNPKDFICLLKVISEFGYISVTSTIDQLLEKKIKINTDNIKIILNRSADFIPSYANSNILKEALNQLDLYKEIYYNMEVNSETVRI